MPPRHQSLGALIDWSLDELDHADATLLHRLTVFAGSFGADDIAGVLGAESVTATRRLVDRSLVAAAVASGRTSFRVLHVMRERIHHRLGPVTDDMRAAHARWYLSKARSAGVALMSSHESAGRDTLNEILDELRAVDRWSSERDRPIALALSATILPFAHSSLNDEVLSWADRLLPHRPGDDRDDAAIVIVSSATRLLRHGELTDGAELARQAIALAEHAEGRLAALETLADATLDEGLLDESDAAFQALLDEGRRAGNAWYASSGATGVLLVAAYVVGRRHAASTQPPSAARRPSALGHGWPTATPNCSPRPILHVLKRSTVTPCPWLARRPTATSRASASRRSQHSRAKPARSRRSARSVPRSSTGWMPPTTRTRSPRCAISPCLPRARPAHRDRSLAGRAQRTKHRHLRQRTRRPRDHRTVARGDPPARGALGGPRRRGQAQHGRPRRWALATIDQHITHPHTTETFDPVIADRIPDSSGHGS